MPKLRGSIILLPLQTIRSYVQALQAHLFACMCIFLCVCLNVWSDVRSSRHCWGPQGPRYSIKQENNPLKYSDNFVQDVTRTIFTVAAKGSEGTP